MMVAENDSGSDRIVEPGMDFSAYNIRRSKQVLAVVFSIQTENKKNGAKKLSKLTLLSVSNSLTFYMTLSDELPFATFVSIHPKKQMTFPQFTHLTIFPIFLVFSLPFVAMQQVNQTGDTDFVYSLGSPSSCKTYVTYRVKSPYLDIGTISDLFGISRMDISMASTLLSEESLLVPNQLLLVPITCTSNGTHYFSNTTYIIKNDESFYSISIKPFQNLTNFLLVEEMNPEMNPNNLTVGAEAVFPLRCKCPSNSYTQRGINYLITYVWQPGDDLLAVSTMFQASESDIRIENNNRNFTSATCLPVLVPVKLPVLMQKLPLPSLNAKKSKHHVTVLVIIGVSVALLIVISIFAMLFHFVYKKRRTLAKTKSTLETLDLIQAMKASKDESFDSKIGQDRLLPGLSGYLGKPIKYDLKVIMKATMNLSERYRLGGSVYKAKIDGHLFAVKKTRDVEELQMLQRVNHANLVKLTGFTSDIYGNFFIVYEYIENGSLDKWLSSNTSSSSAALESLTWIQRLFIASDVANGLQYLHEHTQPSIVHKDIRMSNIVLDSNFKAKIANFSSAKHATSPIMLNVDVFSFGVVILELLSAKKVMQTRDNGEVVMLWKEIKSILENEDERKERLMKWMDPKLKNSYPIDDALSLAMLGRACTSEMSSERPTMGEIVFNLSVFTQSSSQMNEKSSVSAFETEEILPVINPVIAR